MKIRRDAFRDLPVHTYRDMTLLYFTPSLFTTRRRRDIENTPQPLPILHLATPSTGEQYEGHHYDAFISDTTPLLRYLHAAEYLFAAYGYAACHWSPRRRQPLAAARHTAAAASRRAVTPPRHTP